MVANMTQEEVDAALRAAMADDDDDDNCDEGMPLPPLVATARTATELSLDEVDVALRAAMADDYDGGAIAGVRPATSTLPRPCGSKCLNATPTASLLTIVRQ